MHVASSSFTLAVVLYPVPLASLNYLSIVEVISIV